MLRDSLEAATTEAERERAGLDQKIGQLFVVVRLPEEEYRYDRSVTLDIVHQSS